MSDPFILGVNYWPRRKAMYWWSDFDAGEVREEFAVIADLGMNVVRFFLLWDDFQPTSDTVSRACLDNLGVVMDIAAEHKLELDVTFFTGHMSGPNWSPRWLLDANGGIPSQYNQTQVVSGGQIVSGGYRNPFHDPVALNAARLLLRTVVSRYKDHPAVWMWNLGNEPDLFAWPNSAEAGRAWVRDMTALIDENDGQHPVTCGLHVASLHVDNGLRIDHVYGETDVAVMHAYPMYVSWARHPLDPNVVPFSCALTSALCGKPTLMEEWGGCTALPGEASYVREWPAYGHPRKQYMSSEEDFTAYVEAVLPRLVDVGATGAMMWCYADYVEELKDKPPCLESWHERYFGLVRPDGSLKPHAEAIKRFAATKPTVNPNPARRVPLDITPDEYYQDPTGHLARLYDAYLAQYEPSR
ncbi:MAG: beta-galactosidase [Anaerolineae bacterium]|nr:beta-galactosidase [Anaerolineae bacterium]